MDTRLRHLVRFYALLDYLERALGGARTLAQSSGRMPWPARGVYFFREDGETRTDTGTGPRIVRVGTHALKPNSKTCLWDRLAQHKGSHRSGGGNHRCSIFRLIVGSALSAQRRVPLTTWGVGSTASRSIRTRELAIEQATSQIIGQMPFLWLAITDRPGKDSVRGYIERNSIALLSNYNTRPLDPPSDQWLGYHCTGRGTLLRESGLWNSMHVRDEYEPAFLDTLEQLIDAVRKRT